MGQSGYWSPVNRVGCWAGVRHQRVLLLNYLTCLSAQFEHESLNLQVINGVECDAGGGIFFGNELMKFSEVIASRDEQGLAHRL